MLAVGVVQIIIVEVTGLEQSGQKPDETQFSPSKERSQVKSADKSCSNWLLSTFLIFMSFTLHQI